MEYTSVTFSQLIAHVRAADQTQAIAREVYFNSPAPSIASKVSRASKRSGFIVNKHYSSSDDDSDNETALTCSSIASRKTAVPRRPMPTSRKISTPMSAWFDEDETSSDSSSVLLDNSVIAQRAANAGLNPSKRSRENLSLRMFDHSFSFSKTCITSTSPIEELSPLDRPVRYDAYPGVASLEHHHD